MIYLRDIWNKSISTDHKTRKYEPRDYIYASELGGSVFDTWMKMNAEPITHPPNKRALRKFAMGNWVEHDVKQLLLASGLLIEDQKHVVSEPDESCLSIHGRTDFILANTGKKTAINADLPEFMHDFYNQIRTDKFPETIMELKTISSQMFTKRMLEPSPQHRLQAGFYSSELNMPSIVTYISKDDGCMAEHYIKDIPSVEKDIKDWNSTLADYYRNKERPPLEPLILMNEQNKYVKNWMVEYSSFLNEYGFDTPNHYRSRVAPTLNRWNRVLRKVEKGQKLTDDNKKAMDEMAEFAFTDKLLN